MYTVKFSKFISQHRVQTIGFYIFLVFFIGVGLIDDVSTKSYWITIIACVFSFPVIEDFFCGRKMSLSVYELQPGKNLVHDFFRLFWCSAGLIILIVSLIRASGIEFYPTLN